MYVYIYFLEGFACVHSKLFQLCLSLRAPMDYSLPEACQAPVSMEFSRQDFWSQLLYAPPGDLPDPGIEPASLLSPALAGGFFPTSTTWEALEGFGIM